MNITPLKNAEVFPRLVVCCGSSESVMTTTRHSKVCDGPNSPFPPQFWRFRLLAEHKTKLKHQFKAPQTAQVQSEMKTWSIFPQANVMLKVLPASRLSSAAQVPLGPRRPRPRCFLPVMLRPTMHFQPPQPVGWERLEPPSWDHPAALKNAHQQDGQHQSTALWNQRASWELSVYSLTLSISTKSHQLDIHRKETFLVALADPSDDGEERWLWCDGRSYLSIDTSNHSPRQPGFHSDVQRLRVRYLVQPHLVFLWETTHRRAASHTSALSSTHTQCLSIKAKMTHLWTEYFSKSVNIKVM